MNILKMSLLEKLQLHTWLTFLWLTFCFTGQHFFTSVQVSSLLREHGWILTVQAEILDLPSSGCKTWSSYINSPWFINCLTVTLSHPKSQAALISYP